MNPVSDIELSGVELWRRQQARNVMDCYAAGMDILMKEPGERRVEALTRWMVEGMVAVKTKEDERAFYKTAVDLCRGCAETGGEKGSVFRIYAAIFEDMSGQGGGYE
jgi:hypothetical protein